MSLSDLRTSDARCDGGRRSGPAFGVTLHPGELDAPLRWRKPRLVFVNSMSDLFHEDLPFAFGNYAPGRFAWVLRDVQAVYPSVPFRGSQGIFDVPDELLGCEPAQGALL